MLVASIIVKHLPWRVEAARRSDSQQRRRSRLPRRGCAPLVVYDADSPLRRVVDAAPGYGIHPGMPLTTALARCPDAAPIPADHDAYAQQWQAVVARLRGLRDVAAVDDASLGIARALIDSRDGTNDADGPGCGSGHNEARLVADLMRCVPADWEPCVGVASDAFAAHCAASVVRPGHAVRVPDAAELRRRFLAPLSVNLLPLDVRALAALHDQGIHRLGQLNEIPPAALIPEPAMPSASRHGGAIFPGGKRSCARSHAARSSI